MGTFSTRKIIGLPMYIQRIAIPSVFNRNPSVPYYSQLWEQSADVLGGVTDREHSSGKGYPYSSTAVESIVYLLTGID